MNFVSSNVYVNPNSFIYRPIPTLDHKPSNIQYLRVLCKTLACGGFLNKLETLGGSQLRVVKMPWPWENFASCGGLVLPLWRPWVFQGICISCSPNPQTNLSYQIHACACLWQTLLSVTKRGSCDLVKERIYNYRMFPEFLIYLRTEVLVLLPVGGWDTLTKHGFLMFPTPVRASKILIPLLSWFYTRKHVGSLS